MASGASATEILYRRISGSLEQGSDFCPGQKATAPWRKITKAKGAKPDTLQSQDGQAEIPAHPADLTVDPLVQYHPQPGVAIGLHPAFHFDRTQCLSLCQGHATAHGRQGCCRNRTANKDIIGLGLMMAGVHQTLRQLAIIGQQQQSL